MAWWRKCRGVYVVVVSVAVADAGAMRAVVVRRRLMSEARVRVEDMYIILFLLVIWLLWSVGEGGIWLIKRKEG